MKLDIWQKDMTIIADFARQVGCPTPLFDRHRRRSTLLPGAVMASEDTAAVCAGPRKIRSAKLKFESQSEK